MPLLFGVALDELFVDTAANKRDCLLFEVLRLFTGHFLALLIDARLGFSWRKDVWPNLAKGIHIERHIVDFIANASNWRIRVAIKFDERVYKIPNVLIVGMENVCAIFVDVNAFDVFCVDVACDVRTLVDDEHFLALLLGAVGNRCSK